MSRLTCIHIASDLSYLIAGGSVIYLSITQFLTPALWLMTWMHLSVPPLGIRYVLPWVSIVGFSVLFWMAAFCALIGVHASFRIGRKSYDA